MRQRFGIAQALIGAPRLIIVDEPTAGLDPEERNRFLNLLSEIGEHVVVILSTHLVEDVRQLCPAMAIIRSGRVVLTGAPESLVRDMQGRVWQRRVERGEHVGTEGDHVVLSTQLAGGVRSIRVLAHAPPSSEYVSVAPILEDVYFAALAGEVVR
jgi:ABC-type multidrug transport system ATPase subunit